MAAKKLSSSDIFLIHLSSRLGVLLSATGLAAALGAALLGNYWSHVALIIGSVMAGFVVSIAASYIVSGLRGKQHATMPLVKVLLLALPIAAPISPILGIALGPTGLAPYLSGILALAAIPAIVAALLSRHTVRTSMAGIAFSSILGALYTAWGTLAGIVYDYIWFYTGFLYSYPIPMIYSVSVHSFPSTYHEKPVTPLYWAVMGLNALGLALYASTWQEAQLAGLALLVAGLLAYFPAIGLHHAPRIASRIKASKNQVVRKTHQYFLAGHFYAVLTAILATIYTGLYLYTPTTPLECITHSLAIGFIGTHIFIHAPLMLPVILGIPTARRYNQAPFITLVSAVPVFCYHRLAALALVVIAVLLMTYIVWPPPRRKPGGKPA